MMRSKIALILCLACLAACNNQDNGQELPPDVDPVNIPRYATGLSFSSKLMGTTIPYDILLPEGYVADTETSYPVVYCFHGYNNDNTTWNGSSMQIQGKIESLERKGVIPPMIYVFPMGYNSYWVDRFNGSYPYMTMFATEFVPMIDKSYRTIADRTHRAVVGFSMGAFGSLATAMQHPDLFSTCAAMSISMRTDQQYMEESQSAWDNQWGKVFGGSGSGGEYRLTDYYKSLCPLHQFTEENKSKYSSVNWFITCGDNEKTLLYANDDLHVLMLNNGYEHEYRVGEGGHSESYWRPAMDEILPWFKYLMDGNTDWQQPQVEVKVPEDCSFEADGAYLSQGYVNAGKKEGTAIYVFHNNLDQNLINDAIAILQRGLSLKKLIILPCDISKKSPSKWVEQWESIYTVKARQAIAFEDAGTSLINDQSPFSCLYFDNVAIKGDIQIDKNKYYLISQCDKSQNYSYANKMYKACKESNCNFDYRCRNHDNDSRKDFLAGAEYVKKSLQDI